MVSSYCTLALLALLAPCFASITPTSPDASTVVKVGDPINALWTTDTTGSWKDVQIDLMTGENLAMITLETLATGIDGTTATSYSTPAPNVTPNAAIYFLQFTLGGNVSTATWTTRFTIAGSDGSTTQPTNSTVYNGVSVAWGIGTLIASPASNSTTSSASSTTSISSASTTSGSSATGLTVYTSGMPSSAAAALSASTNSMATTVSPSISASSTSKTSGAKCVAYVRTGGVLLAGVMGMLLS